MSNKKKVAVAGAGIYGSTAAIRLAAEGYEVTLYDPIGIMCAASVINQFRIHRGYHYPRSIETINEILEARTDFIKQYKQAIVEGVQSFYSIPHNGSLTNPSDFEAVCERFSLPIKRTSPNWINFEFIDVCYEVHEDIYDPLRLAHLVREKLKSARVRFVNKKFNERYSDDFDFVVYATYGTSGSHTCLFEKVQLQVAEKILIELPAELKMKSLVIVDGQFTAFDPYSNSGLSQFGSAKYTNHWISKDADAPIPDKYLPYINAPEYQPVDFSNFDQMVEEAELAVPLCRGARYIGSRFTLRLIEDDPSTDRRILRIGKKDEKTLHVFSGKVVSAVKAADLILKELQHE